MCDGLVWAELGASMPQAGGSYQYLKESYGAKRLGRLMSFLFVWQLIFSAPLSIASGCLGIARYADFVWPSLAPCGRRSHASVIGLRSAGRSGVPSLYHPGHVCCDGKLPARVVAALSPHLGHRTAARYLSGGVLGAILLVIFAGLTPLHTARAFSLLPEHSIFSSGFFTGLGAAMLMTTYDYWGYYNVCFLGAEIKRRNAIFRAPC